MIPIARTKRPESAASMLVSVFRHVIVQAHHDNHVKIRFRADLVKDERVFFGKVPSQIVKWKEQGGVLIAWRRVDTKEGPHDAILFAECPKSLEEIYLRANLTRTVAVAYTPPTWRLHEERIAFGTKDKHPSNGLRQFKRFRVMTDMLANAPILSRAYLARLPHVRAAASPPSPAPGSPAGAAHSAGTTDSTP